MKEEGAIFPVPFFFQVKNAGRPEDPRLTLGKL